VISIRRAPTRLLVYDFIKGRFPARSTTSLKVTRKPPAGLEVYGKHAVVAPPVNETLTELMIEISWRALLISFADAEARMVVE